VPRSASSPGGYRVNGRIGGTYHDTRHDLNLTIVRQRQGPRREQAVLCPGYLSVSVAGVVIDNRPALPVRRRDKCYAMLTMSIYATCREHGHSGAVLPASDRIVTSPW
jgi:hypothetical protein